MLMVMFVFEFLYLCLTACDTRCCIQQCYGTVTILLHCIYSVIGNCSVELMVSDY